MAIYSLTQMHLVVPTGSSTGDSRAETRPRVMASCAEKRNNVRVGKEGGYSVKMTRDNNRVKDPRMYHCTTFPVVVIEMSNHAGVSLVPCP